MYSVPMSLVDLIPVFLFGAAAVILQKDLYGKMTRAAFTLFAAGTVEVFTAGFLKAIYKLLYALNICDFEVLSKMFFPLQAIGFVLSGLGLLSLIIKPQSKDRLYAVAAPVTFTGTVIFVVLMVAGLFGVDFSMSALAKKMNRSKVIILFSLSFVMCLMMGYLSSKDFTQSYMNWAAELVNTLGQLFLYIGAKKLTKKN